MESLSKRYTKILSDIRSNISNKDERKFVETKLIELSSIYLELLDRLTKANSVKISRVENSQEEIIRKIAKIQESVNIIKNEVYDYDGYEFEIICPYCNFDFLTEVENDKQKEINCPNCNNIIELDWEDSDKENNIESKKDNKIISDDDDEF